MDHCARPEPSDPDRARWTTVADGVAALGRAVAYLPGWGGHWSVGTAGSRGHTETGSVIDTVTITYRGLDGTGTIAVATIRPERVPSDTEHAARAALESALPWDPADPDTSLRARLIAHTDAVSVAPTEVLLDGTTHPARRATHRGRAGIAVEVDDLRVTVSGLDTDLTGLRLSLHPATA